MLATIHKIKKNLSIGIIYFFICAVNVYFMCEVLKVSKIIKIEHYNFENCVNAFKTRCWFYLPEEKIEYLCGELNNKESYSKFLKNLMFMLMTLKVLLYDISCQEFNIKYWLTVHLCALGFSFLNYVPLLQFSLESNKSYSVGQILIISIVGVFIIALIIRQALRPKRLRYTFLLSIVFLYMFLYTLLKTIGANFKLHFHHSFCSGILSICFTDFNSNINFYMHGLLIGIVIQGINIYTINEIFPFDVHYTKAPDLNYMLWLFGIYFVFCCSLSHSCCHVPCCKKEEKKI